MLFFFYSTHICNILTEIKFECGNAYKSLFLSSFSANMLTQAAITINTTLHLKDFYTTTPTFQTQTTYLYIPSQSS